MASTSGGVEEIRQTVVQLSYLGAIVGLNTNEGCEKDPLVVQELKEVYLGHS